MDDCVADQAGPDPWLAIQATATINTDITGILLQSVERQHEWSLNALRELVGRLATDFPAVRVDWDWESGEDWARLLSGDQVIGILHARLPFAMFLTPRSRRATFLVAA